jgi:hypothetical protein
MPKAESVTQAGQPDGWLPPTCWRAQVAPDGNTRLVVSVAAEKLAETHLKLLQAMSGPVGVMYAQLTSRQQGQHPRPVRFLGLELPLERVIAVFQEVPKLVWEDGRHQLWVRGSFGEQVVLDELGVLYCYPDDPSFRDALLGIPESSMLGMDGRDYVKVTFFSEADAQEQQLLSALNMVKVPE